MQRADTCKGALRRMSSAYEHNTSHGTCNCKRHVMALHSLNESSADYLILSLRANDSISCLHIIEYFISKFKYYC